MRDWKQRARRARKLRRTAKHGSQQASWSTTLANGNNANTVRRAVAALKYHYESGHRYPDIKRCLATAPLSAVELLARIDKVDARAARSAAEQLAAGGHTVRSLMATLTRLRRQFKLDDRFKTQELDQTVAAAIGNLLDDTISTTERPANWLLAKVDVFARLHRASGQLETVAIVFVGPYQSAGQYRHRLSDWLSRAMAAAWLADHVVLVQASPRYLEDYRNALERIDALAASKCEGSAVRSPKVSVLTIELAK